MCRASGLRDAWPFHDSHSPIPHSARRSPRATPSSLHSHTGTCCRHQIHPRPSPASCLMRYTDTRLKDLRRNATLQRVHGNDKTNTSFFIHTFFLLFFYLSISSCHHIRVPLHSSSFIFFPRNAFFTSSFIPYTDSSLLPTFIQIYPLYHQPHHHPFLNLRRQHTSSPTQPTTCVSLLTFSHT